MCSSGRGGEFIVMMVVVLVQVVKRTAFLKKDLLDNMASTFAFDRLELGSSGFWTIAWSIRGSISI